MELALAIDNGTSINCELGELSRSGDTGFASASFMIEVPSSAILEVALSADGATLCTSPKTQLGDEDWICMKSISAPDGAQSRLLSCTCDVGQYSFTLDAKDSGGPTVLLRKIHLVHRQQQQASLSVDGSLTSSILDDTTAGDDASFDANEALDALSSRSYQLIRLTNRAIGCSDVRTMLSGVLSGEQELPEALLQVDTWRLIAQGLPGLNVRPECGLCPDGAAVEATAEATDGLSAVSAELKQRGHSRLPEIDWAAAGISMDALAEGAQRLRQAGLPPCFLFVYDEPWKLCAMVGERVQALMGADAALDPAVFAWALEAAESAACDVETSATAAAAPRKIGSNFGRPHRDSSYVASHTESGAPSELSVWVALTRVTPTNGSIYVVPSCHDPLFAKPHDPLHMQPDKTMPWPHVRPLPCEAGSVLLWHASLIHWGSACDAGEAHPRKSIAFAYKLPCAGSTARGRGRQHGGRAALRLIPRAQLAAGLSIRERLRLVVQALLKYEHWHPTFDGLAEEALSHRLRAAASREECTTVQA